MRARSLRVPFLGVALALGCAPRGPDPMPATTAPSSSPASPTATKAEPVAHDDAAALGLDGTTTAYERTLRAIDRIVKASDTAATPALVDTLAAILANPRLDPTGEVREALIVALEAVGDRRAVPVLIAVLEQPIAAQPVTVHRRAADVLGRFADPTAVDALLTAVFRVPDAFTTTNIAERSKIALAAIGAPAVPRVVDLLEGRHAAIGELAQQHGIDATHLVLAAAGYLGTIGSREAVEPLLRALPTGDCGARPQRDGSAGDDVEVPMRRAMIANALGQLGDERAVEPLCRCATASKDPGDMFTIAEALGRIGGERATECLAQVIRTGVYDRDLVESPDFVHEIRWEAARFGILAAGPEGLPIVEAAMRAKGQPAAVTRNLARWDAGRALLERCGRDSDCLQQVLADPAADWFAREVAAVTLARQSPGDLATAERIAAAFAVRNPDARVTMAWLAAHVMRGARCPRCASMLHERLEQERLTRPPKEYQLSVLMARYSIARLRVPKGG
jgi:HEAT repeat protein